MNDDKNQISKLMLVRHGESAGNLARNLAESKKLSAIDIPMRDTDVPLSDLGERQALALGEWLREHQGLPSVVISSPYLRAKKNC